MPSRRAFLRACLPALFGGAAYYLGYAAGSRWDSPHEFISLGSWCGAGAVGVA